MRNTHRSPHRVLVRGLLLPFLALSIVALDQITKSIAIHHLAVGEPVEVMKSVLSFELVRNPGSAFSLSILAGPVLVVIYTSVLAIAVTAMVRVSDTRTATALAVLAGGVFGNLCDRLLRAPSPLHGHVIDWISFNHWPVFNIADSAICISAVLGLVLVLYPTQPRYYPI